MKKLATLILILTTWMSHAQTDLITGQLIDEDKAPISFANVVLYKQADSTMVKVETTNPEGAFGFQGIDDGTYYLKSSYIGLADFEIRDIKLIQQQPVVLEPILMEASSIQLDAAIVTARRAMVEVKPDRTVFNVQGTVNSTGDNGLELLRKAPGVLVDNNNNITVMSRSGVLVYIDGKRLPLTGDDLTNYLQNLTADQIDKIDIITNPGAKYEAQGNAGIIDIRLKKNENHGANGSLNMDLTRSYLWSGGMSASGNYRNGKINTFGQLGVGARNRLQQYWFADIQNQVIVDVYTRDDFRNTNGNLRAGLDYFINANSTVGVLLSGNLRSITSYSDSDNTISNFQTPDMADSLLIANNVFENDFNSQSYNINYAYDNNNRTVNVDLDYGRYRTETDNFQPNSYFSPDGTQVLQTFNTATVTPVDIDIYTGKIDYEQNVWNGKLGLGSKLSKVSTDNSFLFFDIPDQDRIQNNVRSNLFFYDENVYAGYISFSRPINEQWSMTSGLRLEQTVATGDLQAFVEELQEPPVELNYLTAFPSAGLTYTMNPANVISLNYSRRINRPDYNVLNPFKLQMNELSFMKGNPFLQPEIVNNIELGYLWKYRYNFRLAYSRTTDQITRLIGPDDSDPRARFINWDNLAVQTIISANASLPIQVSSFWNAFFNISGSHLDNQADYGDGGVVDVQAWTYNIFQQHTLTLPKGFIAEVSGWFAGPGVWGGVFRYETSWSLNLGLQKKFLDNKLNVKVSAQDIFRQAFWSGYSEFNGLRSEGMGDWDSRRVSVNLNYNFGNTKVKSRNRKTSLEEEEGRIGEG